MKLGFESHGEGKALTNEWQDEKMERDLFSQTLKMQVRPACYFAVALNSEKAAKLTPEQCEEILYVKYQQRQAA